MEQSEIRFEVLADGSVAPYKTNKDANPNASHGGTHSHVEAIQHEEAASEGKHKNMSRTNSVATNPLLHRNQSNGPSTGGGLAAQAQSVYGSMAAISTSNHRYIGVETLEIFPKGFVAGLSNGSIVVFERVEESREPAAENGPVHATGVIQHAWGSSIAQPAGECVLSFRRARDLAFDDPSASATSNSGVSTSNNGAANRGATETSFGSWIAQGITEGTRPPLPSNSILGSVATMTVSPSEEFLLVSMSTNQMFIVPIHNLETSVR
jgi:hypothetical protein